MLKKIFFSCTALLLAFTFSSPLSADETEYINEDGQQNEKKENKKTLTRLSFYQDNYFITGYKYGFSKFNDEDDEGNQVKFQFSIKYLLDWDVGNWLTSDLFNFYFIYTQKHFWNLFDASAPFKEINFSPGLMANFNFDMMFLYKVDFIPILHESNGRDGLQDRSWNRVILNLGLVKFKYFQLDAAGFYVYPFNKSEYNDNIVDYSGYFEIFAKASDNVNNPLFQLDYRFRAAKEGLTHIVDFKMGLFHLINNSFPKDVVIHLQLYYGYLESLESHDQKTARIRLGIGLI